MISPDPRERPSAVTLCQHPALCPAGKKTKAQLRRELNEERMKNQLLSKYVIHHISNVEYILYILQNWRCFLNFTRNGRVFKYCTVTNRSQCICVHDRYLIMMYSIYRQLLEATRGQITSNPLMSRGKSSRLIGKKVNRSVSMTYF